MSKKKKVQTLAEQWAAYLYLKKETKLCIPAMDAMRHAAALRMRKHLHRKNLPGKRNASRKKEVPGEQFLVYRFVAKPTEEQEQFLRQSAGNCRFLWNQMLNDFKTTGSYQTPAGYKKNYNFLTIGDATSLSNVQLNFQAAVNDWQKGDKGFPKFKKKGLAKESFRSTVVYGKNGNGNMCLTKTGIRLPKRKEEIKLRIHRSLPENMVLKNCTCTLEPNGQWMFSIQFSTIEEQDELSPFALTEVKHIGLDMSLPCLYIDSLGNHADYEKPYRKVEAKLAKEQRKLSHMKFGSSNYMKQKQSIAKLHAKAKHQRSDRLHKLSCMLTDTYDLITIEDLDMAAMKKSLHFGKSVSDNGWGMFVNMLLYKAARKGKLVLFDSKWFPSSKTCLACGHVHKELQLSDRMYECPVCGHVMDRDEQAAKNIDEEGLRIYRQLQNLLFA